MASGGASNSEDFARVARIPDGDLIVSGAIFGMMQIGGMTLTSVVLPSTPVDGLAARLNDVHCPG